MFEPDLDNVTQQRDSKSSLDLNRWIEANSLLQSIDRIQDWFSARNLRHARGIASEIRFLRADATLECWVYCIRLVCLLL